MSQRIDELSEQLCEQNTAATLAEGSALEALRNGQFDRAHQAVDDAKAAWERRLDLRDEIVEIITDGRGPE